MAKCPNCGQKTGGDFCKWCGYPLRRSRASRKEAEGAKFVREAEKEAKKVSEEKARKEAKQAKQEAIRAKREAEKRAKLEAREAKEKAKREAKEAEEKAKREAKETEEKAKREAEEKAKREAEEAKRAKLEAREAEERAKREARRGAKEAAGAELYKGEVNLVIEPPIALDQMRKLEEFLCQVQNLRLVLIGGSVEEGTKIIVSAEKPIPLVSVLSEMSPVERVAKKGSEILVTLKAEQ